MMQINTNWS